MLMPTTLCQDALRSWEWGDEWPDNETLNQMEAERDQLVELAKRYTRCLTACQHAEHSRHSPRRNSTQSKRETFPGASGG